MDAVLGELRGRDPRRALLTASAAAAVSVLGLVLIVEATRHGVPLIVLPFAIGAVAWLCLTRRTGIALTVILVYLGTLDGYLKLRTGSTAVSLGRDVLIYALAAGMAIRTRHALRVPALAGWVLAWVAVVLVQILNPGDASVGHAVASTRQHLEFVPLFFIGFTVMRTHRSLHAFFAVLLAAAAVNGLVAAYQTRLSPQQLASWGSGYARLEEGPSARTFNTTSGVRHVRPPALGSDEGFSGDLGATAIPGGFILLWAFRRRRWRQALIILGLLGTVVGVLSSQSRSSVIMALAAALALLGLLSVARQARQALLIAFVVVAMGLVAVELIGSYDSSAFDRYRSLAPGSASSTISSARTSTYALTPKYLVRIPFGAGLGNLGPAASKAGGRATMWNGESEINFLIVETGIPGLFVMIGLQLALGWLIVTGLRRERDPQAALLLSALAAPLFGYVVTWFVGVYTTEPPSAPYLWFAAGVLSWWLVTRPREDRASATGDALSAPLGS